MRAVLFRIPIAGSVSLGALGEVPLFGWGVVLAAWLLLGALLAIYAIRRLGWNSFPWVVAMYWIAIAAAIVLLPRFTESIPVYGYGAMLFIGFASATWVAAHRIRRLGYDGDIAWDAAIWLFVAGIVGARLFYVIQYREQFFLPGISVPQLLVRLISLPDGGIVFYGGLIGGAVACMLFCYRRRLNGLAMADIVITSLFIGMAFGRVGCLLYGCCYGDYCTLPWAITFPPDSVPVRELVTRGFLATTASSSLPLHPTQIYSALGAALLALLTYCYYPFRQKDGSVLLLGWLTYPVHRFIVEFLRGDELGQFGTSLTISQWVSLGLLCAGGLFALWHARRPAGRHPLVYAPQPLSRSPALRTG